MSNTQQVSGTDSRMFQFWDKRKQVKDTPENKDIARKMQRCSRFEVCALIHAWSTEYNLYGKGSVQDFFDNKLYAWYHNCDC